MSLQRQDHLVEIKEWLIRLERSIDADKLLSHQDSYIEIEYFFRDLCNQVFGWQLENANMLSGKSQDSFDLSDKDGNLAVQVTVTTDAKKIRDTLNSFIGTHDKKYKRLVFIYPQINLGESRADFSKQLQGYNFDAKRDRLSLGTVLEKAQDMDITKQARLLEFLRSELKPLGKALQMGVDQTVETLIAAISYMSENAPLGAINPNETKPDQKQKLERYQGHAHYIISQYRFNQPLHATLDMAREAIGYDTARAAKIQVWPKTYQGNRT